MRKNILPVAVMAAMAFGGAAFAGTTAATTTTTATMTPVVAAPADVTGTITKISTKGLYVVVAGWKYHVAKGFSFSDLKVGEKVTITFTMNGKLHEASAVKAA